jgi:hypothetical protein
MSTIEVLEYNCKYLAQDMEPTREKEKNGVWNFNTVFVVGITFLW